MKGNSYKPTPDVRCEICGKKVPMYDKNGVPLVSVTQIGYVCNKDHKTYIRLHRKFRASFLKTIKAFV